MARILAVDDDADALLLIGESLRGAGHEVVTCEDPAEVPGLTAAVAYDALVLDLNMPGRSGFEVLRSLRSEVRTRDLPVIVLSVRGDSADRVRGLREGADDYLVKPFDPDELALRVERLVAKRSARGALAGDLETYPLWSLLQTLARARRSGTILIVADERSAELYLAGGRLIEVRVGRLAGEEATVAALGFLRGSFRFFEGDLRGGAPAAAGEGLDAASLVLRHAWLLEEVLRHRGALPRADEPFAFLDPPTLKLPQPLGSPAVQTLLAHLRATGEATLGGLETLEVAAPLTVAALLAYLGRRGAIRPVPRPLGTEDAAAPDLAERLDAVLDRLFESARERRPSMRNLHILLLASPRAWEGLVALLSRLPAGSSPFHPGDLTGIVSRQGGSWLLRHSRGDVSLHLQALVPGAQRQAAQLLPLCAGVVVWAEGPAELAAAVPLASAVERSSWGQTGALFLPAEHLGSARPEFPRWQARAAPPADLVAALSPLTAS